METERNQFKRLRYKSDSAIDPELSQRELAKKLGLAVSTISKAEKEGYQSLHASTLKAYHEKLGVSYEYLMGESKAKNRKYHTLSELLPFQDSFYRNLQQLLSYDKQSFFPYHQYLLEAMFSNPEQLSMLLNKILDNLFDINVIQSDPEISEQGKRSLMQRQESRLGYDLIQYLEITVMPLLQKVFDAKNDELASDAELTQQAINEMDSALFVEDVSTPTVTSDIVELTEEMRVKE